MTISEEKLLAFADGLLPADEAAEIDRQLADDAEARALLDTLRRSDLPYRDAVEATLETPDLSHIASHIRTYRQPARLSYLSKYAPIAASIAVFFVVGLLAGQHVFPPDTPKQTQWAVWVDRIASYQALYSRDTLPAANPPAERRMAQWARVKASLGVSVAAPDLARMDAHYKYAKIFAIDGKPLAQIAYLPKTGAPFSLCLMKTDKPDHAPRFSKAHGVNVAAWRKGGVAYILVGATPKEAMDRYIGEIRQQIGA